MFACMKVLMNENLRELYTTGKSRLYREVERTTELREGFMRAIRVMIDAANIQEVKAYSFLHYERLKHEWSGYSSVRLSNRYVHRLIFKEINDLLEIQIINIDDSHYGNK